MSELESEKALKLLNFFVLFMIAGQFIFSIVSYAAGDAALGHASLGLFLLWVILYWFFGMDYFEINTENS